MKDRTKLMSCGHASRYRNKRGCVKCRRENGATMPKHDYRERKKRRERKERKPSVMERQLREAGLVS